MTAHDHGHCELCDQLERENAVAITHLRSVVEALSTQEPRLDVIRSLERVIKSLAYSQSPVGDV
jgi:hypothetical protein